MKKRIAIFGSTGSIGTQALEVIGNHPERFEVEVLTAHSNADLLIRQAITHRPNAVVISNEDLYEKVFTALDKLLIKVYSGEEALSQVAGMGSVDQVLMGIVGFAALKPVMSSLEHKIPVALANKECLVVAGKLITELMVKNNTPIIPIDSELSAIFQCLTGEFKNPANKIILTASGGPFRGYSKEQLKNITVNEALLHPNWNMGDKVTIDSATLMNKGFEAISASWLFGLKPEQIEVLVHPQSIVHSLVMFNDGSVKSLMSPADMRIPVQYALSFPERLDSGIQPLDLADIKSLTFELPDVKNFRNLALAFKSLEKGGNSGCILNASNELGVRSFLKQKIGFTDIANLVEHCMKTVSFIKDPELDDLIETDRLTRATAEDFIKSIS